MSNTIKNLLTPSILLTGTRIIKVNGVDTNSSVTNYKQTNQIEETSALHYYQHGELKFKGPVTVTMTCNLALKKYNIYQESQLKQVGQWIDNKNVNKAEIYYTINGAASFGVAGKLYKKPLTLKHANTGDKYVIRAKVYWQGHWSSVTRLTLIVI